MKVGRVFATARTVDDATISIRLAHAIEAAMTRAFLAVEPATSFVVEGGGSELALRGQFTPGTLYRVRLRAGLPSTSGRFLVEDVVRAIRIPDLPSSCSFVGAGSFLLASGQRLLTVRSVNMDRLDLSVE